MFKKKSLRINSYIGYGTSTKFYARGRALEDENISFDPNLSTFRTVMNIYKQFESDEIPKVNIKAELPNGQVLEQLTDEEGYYCFSATSSGLDKKTDKEGWLPFSVSYADPAKKDKISDENRFKGEMLIPSESAEFAIISDIDDTILHTGVTSIFKWRVIINTLLKNFDKRIPIEGTASFYTKLHFGKNNLPVNPIFYVSNSPWNLFDYLTAFLKKNLFPKGPILLRDFRTPFDKTPKPKMPHKKAEIINLLNMYPHLNFILIGDSGEKDANIYTKIAKEFPNRILAIYVRDVMHSRKSKRIQKMIEHFKECPMLLVKTSEQAVAHARALGFII